MGDPSCKCKMGMGLLKKFLVQVRKFKPDFIPHDCAKCSDYTEIDEGNTNPGSGIFIQWLKSKWIIGIFMLIKFKLRNIQSV